MRLNYLRDADIYYRLAREESQAKFIRECIRKQIAEENEVEVARNDDNVFTVYSPQHDITFLLNRDKHEYELLGMCNGELGTDLARKYVGQFRIKK